VAVFYSGVDAYTWVKEDQINVPVQEATEFAAQDLVQNQTLLLACPVNRFNQFMIWYYLNAKIQRSGQNQTLQYPQQAVDAYTAEFNITDFIQICQTYNVRYVLLYEYGGNRYFNSTLTTKEVLGELNETSKFLPRATFGNDPHRIYVLEFR
jgi:hypothetical protein